MKIIKIIGIVLTCLVFGIVILYLYADNKNDMDKNFRSKINVTSLIESKYLEQGQFEVDKLVIDADDPIGKYSIFYPREMQYTSKKYPLLFVVNGTGGKATKYEALFEHYSSWGS